MDTGIFSPSSQGLSGSWTNAPLPDRHPGRLELSEAWVAWLGGSPQQQALALGRLVLGTDRLVEQGQDVHGPSWAAHQRAALHRLLMGLVQSLPVHSALRREALWHSRLSHEALVVHLQQHGPSTVIEEALRAGCLLLRWPGAETAARRH